jgi:hypothetical protein
MATPRSEITLDTITALCDQLYARDGFVKWADVGRALGVSRQAIQLRLRAAVDKGLLPPERVEQWQSMTSRAAASRERAKAAKDRSHEADKLLVKIRLTPENHAWLRQQSVLRRSTTADLVNGLITKARLVKE